MDGSFLVGLARETIEGYLKDKKVIKPPKDTPPKLKEKAGVFITLMTYPKKELRGCIGYPEPVAPLIDAAIEASISAATKDPRFLPMKPEEMDTTLVEVSILTPPQIMNVEDPKDYLDMIQIGRDGLIVERGSYRGLLLPQVPLDQGWDKIEFISYTCMKAGMESDCWLEGDTKVYRFQGMVFQELTPKGEIQEKVLTSC